MALGRGRRRREGVPQLDTAIASQLHSSEEVVWFEMLSTDDILTEALVTSQVLK